MQVAGSDKSVGDVVCVPGDIQPVELNEQLPTRTARLGYRHVAQKRADLVTSESLRRPSAYLSDTRVSERREIVSTHSWFAKPLSSCGG